MAGDKRKINLKKPRKVLLTSMVCALLISGGYYVHFDRASRSVEAASGISTIADLAVSAGVSSAEGKNTTITGSFSFTLGDVSQRRKVNYWLFASCSGQSVLSQEGTDEGVFKPSFFSGVNYNDPQTLVNYLTQDHGATPAYCTPSASDQNNLSESNPTIYSGPASVSYDHTFDVYYTPGEEVTPVVMFDYQAVDTSGSVTNHIYYIKQTRHTPAMIPALSGGLIKMGAEYDNDAGKIAVRIPSDQEPAIRPGYDYYLWYECNSDTAQVLSRERDMSAADVVNKVSTACNNSNASVQLIDYPTDTYYFYHRYAAGLHYALILVVAQKATDPGTDTEYGFYFLPTAIMPTMYSPSLVNPPAFGPEDDDEANGIMQLGSGDLLSVSWQINNMSDYVAWRCDMGAVPGDIEENDDRFQYENPYLSEYSMSRRIYASSGTDTVELHNYENDPVTVKYALRCMLLDAFHNESTEIDGLTVTEKKYDMVQTRIVQTDQLNPQDYGFRIMPQGIARITMTIAQDVEGCPVPDPDPIVEPMTEDLQEIVSTTSYDHPEPVCVRWRVLNARSCSLFNTMAGTETATAAPVSGTNTIVGAVSQPLFFSSLFKLNCIGTDNRKASKTAIATVPYTLPVPTVTAGGDCAIGGNNELRTTLFCAQSLSISENNTGGSNFFGSFVSRNTNLDKAQNSHFYYDSDMSKNAPPGFRYLQIPMVKEVSPN